MPLVDRIRIFLGRFLGKSKNHRIFLLFFLSSLKASLHDLQTFLQSVNPWPYNEHICKHNMYFYSQIRVFSCHGLTDCKKIWRSWRLTFRDCRKNNKNILWFVDFPKKRPEKIGILTTKGILDAPIILVLSFWLPLQHKYVNMRLKLSLICSLSKSHSRPNRRYETPLMVTWWFIERRFVEG